MPKARVVAVSEDRGIEVEVAGARVSMWPDQDGILALMGDAPECWCGAAADMAPEDIVALADAARDAAIRRGIAGADAAIEMLAALRGGYRP